MKLTAANISKLPTPAKPIKFYDQEVRSLFLKVTPTRRMGWYVHLKKPNGKYTDMKLGDYSMFTPKEARDEANEKLLASKRGIDVAQKRRRDEAGTLKGFLHKRYETYVKQNHKDATNTLRVLKETFSEFADTPLPEITVDAVEQWRLRRLREKTIKGTTVQPQTINRNTALLKAALGKARIWGIIETNPLDDLSLLRVEKKPVEFLEETEIKELTDALVKRDQKNIQERKKYNQWCVERGKPSMFDPTDLEIDISDYLHPLVVLVLNTGLRLGEALGLRWSDISNDNVLTVRAGKTGTIRYVPLPLDAELILRHWHRLHEKVTEGHPELHDVVFITMNRGGRPRPLTSVKTSFANVRKDLSFVCDFKTLRRTYGSTLIRKGVAVYKVSKLLGHSNITTTQNWYLNLGMDEYKQAVALLNTLEF
jgi:integrase